MPGQRVGVEYLEQELPPPLEKEGAIVELDREHVPLGRNIEPRERVADLLRASSTIRRAVADQRQRFPADDAVVCGPDPAAGWVDHAWIALRRQEATPTGIGLRPVRRDRGGVAGAAQRDAAEQRPAQEDRGHRADAGPPWTADDR